MPAHDSSEGQFLVVHGPDSAWAIHARHVARFVAKEEWHGRPLPTAREPFAALEPDGEGRLMVLNTDSGERVVWITGSVTMRYIEPDKVVPLPALCRPRSSALLTVRAVAVEENEILFLIVEPGDAGAG